MRSSGVFRQVVGILFKITILNNNPTTPCNTPEDRRFHQHRGGSSNSSQLQFDKRVLADRVYRTRSKTRPSAGDGLEL
jgi:hypothetical protein